MTRASKQETKISAPPEPVAVSSQPQLEPPLDHKPDRLFLYLGALPFLALLLLSYWGIDFGRHWDEDDSKIQSIEHSLANNFTLLQDRYVYPGVNYWLTFSGLMPDLMELVAQGKSDPREYQSVLAPVLQTTAFRLRVRRIFAFLAALTTVWIYLAVLVWGRSWIEALCASSLCAFSWEVVYHSRWIAPDAVMMQFAALAFLLTSLAWKKNSRPALYGAAAAAGLACGTKYPGALVILPALAVIALSFKSWRRTLVDSAVVAAVMASTYLVTTPGTVLQPLVFFRSIQEEMQIYAHGWLGYTVRPGLEHLAKMLYYFATRLFSPFPPASIVLAAFVCLGVWALFRESRRDALIFLLFPTVYIIYFSSQATMVVRNYLCVAPFLFMLSARGLGWLSERLPSPRFQWSLFAAAGVLLAVNMMDQLSAAETVAHRMDREAFFQDFQSYVTSHPERVMLVSPRVEMELKQRGVWPANLAPSRAAGQRSFHEYLSYYSETITPREAHWPTNRPHSFEAIFGPREVNLDYYTGWRGDDRIISLSPSIVSEMKLFR